MTRTPKVKPDTPLPFASPGLVIGRRCEKCNTVRGTMIGGTTIPYRGIRIWVGACCNPKMKEKPNGPTATP